MPWRTGLEESALPTCCGIAARRAIANLLTMKLTVPIFVFLAAVPIALCLHAEDQDKDVDDAINQAEIGRASCRERV